MMYRLFLLMMVLVTVPSLHAQSGRVSKVGTTAGAFLGVGVGARATAMGGAFVAEPPGDLVLVPGDVIVAMGTVETMDRLETLFSWE